MLIFCMKSATVFPFESIIVLMDALLLKAKNKPSPPSKRTVSASVGSRNFFLRDVNSEYRT